MSFPHFLHADPILREQVDGLSPSEANHEFYLDYEKVDLIKRLFLEYESKLDALQNLAIPMNVKVRLQVNMLIRKNSQIEIMDNWPDHFQLYLPQFWSQTVCWLCIYES